MAKAPGQNALTTVLFTLLSVPGKVFANVFLARIGLQQLVDMKRRPELLSGFVASRSTIALRLLSDLGLHREFDRPLNVAYLDIKAAL